MKNLILSFACALLLPGLYASDLGSSLIDVNRFWAYETNTLSAVSSQHCDFDAVEMIQLHLRLVHEELSSRDVSHLSEQLRENRRRSLENLEYYAERARFPQNLTHQGRRPVFIDHRGVHCAVGYLISASGYPDLSRRISANMNTHYLKDMKDERLSQWVENSGFTLNELAWIQPGYPFPVNWDSMNGGMNGPVFCLSDHPQLGLIAGGYYDTAGGYPIDNLAHWYPGFAGYDWIGLNSSGPDGLVYDILVDSNDIYVAGTLSSIDSVWTGSGVVHWNGSTWEGLGQFYIGGLLNYVNDLVIYRDTLYAGGYFRSDIGAPDFFTNLAKWDGQNWVRAFEDTVLNGSVPGEVKTLHVHNGKLIVGGNFQLTNMLQSRNIFAINGNTPEYFSDDIATTVNDLATYEGELYAATKYLGASAQDTGGLMRWENSQWVALMHGFIYPQSAEIHALEETPYGLVFGGDFNLAAFIDISKNLAAYVKPQSGQDYFRSLGILDSSVLSLEFSNDDLYLGGYFTTGFYTPVPSLGRVSRIRLTDYLHKPETSSRKLSIYPNPAGNYVSIEMPVEKAGNLEVMDMAGRQYKCKIISSGQGVLKLETGNLPDGIYLLRISAAGSQYTARLMVR